MTERSGLRVGAQAAAEISSDLNQGMTGDFDRDPPIFVVGFQRSGTTLLQALLGAHPRIGAPPETYFIFRVYHLRDYFGDLQDDVKLRRVVNATLNPVVPLLADSGFDEDHLYERLKATDRSYRTVFDVMMRDFAERHGKRRWSDKTPGQAASDAWEIFPEAQVVHIVRDPRDVVASSIEMPWEIDNAPTIARRYLRFTLANVAAGTKRGPTQYLRIRYEDLCQDPGATLRLVCAFLGERYTSEMVTVPARRGATIAAAAAPWQLRALEHILPSTEGTWRSRLRRADSARVAAIVDPLLAPYGYSPSGRVGRWAGAALNTLSLPRQRMDALRGGVKARKSLRTPDQRYAAVKRFQEEKARRVSIPTESSSVRRMAGHGKRP